ncbi:kinase-like domain-containing protein [Aspergillus heterothallicus]
MALSHFLFWLYQRIVRILWPSRGLLIQQPLSPDQLQLLGVPTTPVLQDPVSPQPSPANPSSLQANRVRSAAAVQRFQDGLRNFRIRSSVENSHFFISEPILKHLVDDTVYDILASSNNVDRYVQIISQHAVKLFAVLIDMKREDCITQILDEGIRDSDLPFRQALKFDGSTRLATTHEVPIMALQFWDSMSLESLEIKQYRVLSPVFRTHEHYDLLEKNILPFVPHNAEPDSWPKVAGGFGEVYPVCIHQSHHEFGQGDLPVAVKRMFHANDFYHERKAYRDLGPSAHPHIIELLFTYQYRKKFHLVFPWATGTLKDYWKINANPVISSAFFWWAIQQMAGIASGLAYFHDFKDPRTGAPRFGRHGDIKAENILRFPLTYCPGILKIADLGLARIHSENSRSNVDPNSVDHSPTYCPPDAKRKCKISRKYDIWSLGCMYLDWVSYLLLGYQAIKDFSNLRLEGSTSEYAEFRQDTFYTANGEIVNPHVFVWVNKLKQHPRCSQMLHDILDVIMKKMIVILPEVRGSSQDVTQAFERILIHAQQDENYLAGPNLVTESPPAPRLSCCAAEFRGRGVPRTRDSWSTTKARTWNF